MNIEGRIITISRLTGGKYRQVIMSGFTNQGDRPRGF